MSKMNGWDKAVRAAEVFALVSFGALMLAISACVALAP